MNATISDGHVIIMDDEPVIRSLVVKALSRVGLEVEEALDGSAALELLHNKLSTGIDQKKCVMILDLIIPTGMGGKETLLSMRQNTPNVRAVIASGLADDDSLNGLCEPGKTELLTKPYDMKNLIQVVSNLMGGE